MPAPYRTNTGAVLAVLEPGKEYDTLFSPDLTPFMDAAQALTNRVYTSSAIRGYIYTAPELEVIERYLAAHFYCTSDKVYASKSAGGASGSFMQQTGKGLEQTPHGQTALRLDYSGVLNGIDKAARARIISL